MIIKSPAPSDDFYVQRDRYVAAVVADARLTHLAARLGAHLGINYASRDGYRSTGELRAWPGQTRLAEELGCTPDAVRKAAACLARAGFAHVTPGGGRKSTTVYVLTLVDTKGSAVIQLFPGKGQTDRGGFRAAKPQTDRAETPDGTGLKPQTDPGANLKRESTEDSRQSTRGLTAWDRLRGILPERMIKISNLRRAQSVWGPQVAVFGAERLLAAAAAYSRDPVIAKQNHLPALQTWLSEGLFEQFLPSADRPTAIAPATWDGPADIWASVERKGLAESCLRQSTWSEACRTIFPKTTWARTRLLALGQAFWAKHGAEVGEVALPISQVPS